MKRIKKEEWVASDSIALEPNALKVAIGDANYLVVAGPGSGKTELLAQKVSYLLQTNSCKFPYRILAISFKRDAAFNLKERVKLRCGEELSRRFDSYTFDSFAKQIVDRFKRALPSECGIPGDYEILLKDESLLDYYKKLGVQNNSASERKQIQQMHTGFRLPLSNSPDANIATVWKRMLNETPSKVTFKMILRLAELIINDNPLIRTYLQQTYQHVFLDEFQDATNIQYELFKASFLESDCCFTAVGDDKQRIMLWAGAQETVFEDFIKDTSATKVSLKMNFRSAPKLVTLLNHLAQNLLGKSDIAIPSPQWNGDEGYCSVWVFENTDFEIKILFEEVRSWIVKEEIDPREICIIVKQQLDIYAGELIKYFNENGIKARDENVYEDLLTQDLTLYIIHSLIFVFDKKEHNSKKIAFSFLCNLHIESRDEELLKYEGSFAKFIKELRGNYPAETLNPNVISQIVDRIISYADISRIRSVFSQYKNTKVFEEYVNRVKVEIGKNLTLTNNIVMAIDMLLGKETISVMTIHKSKGLEYKAVIFIGLEDGAFWSFQSQPDEDKCAFFVALSRAKEKVIFTFSKKRTLQFGERSQSLENIKILFDEMMNSGVVKIIDKKQ